MAEVNPIYAKDLPDGGSLQNDDLLVFVKKTTNKFSKLAVSWLLGIINAAADLASSAAAAANNAASAANAAAGNANNVQAYVDQSVAALVGGAPAQLNTLKELSDALGGDANFAATIINQLSGKAPTSHTHTISQITNLLKGQANGIASLGADGIVPAAQLPSSVGGTLQTLTLMLDKQAFTFNGSQAKTIYYPLDIITATPSNTNSNSDAGSKIITLNAQYAWTAVLGTAQDNYNDGYGDLSLLNGLTLSQSSGGDNTNNLQITASYGANMLFAQRRQKITFTSQYGKSVSIVLLQSGNSSAYIDVSSTDVHLPTSMPSSQTITIQSGQNWGIKWQQGDFFSVSPNSGSSGTTTTVTITRVGGSAGNTGSFVVYIGDYYSSDYQVTVNVKIGA